MNILIDVLAAIGGTVVSALIIAAIYDRALNYVMTRRLW